MDEITLTTVQDFIKKNADKPEVQNYVKGFITPDGVKSYIESEDGMKIIQPKLDQHFSKSLETWKTTTMPKIIEDETNKVIATKYPTETEEQKRLRKLEQDLLAETTKRQKAEMYNLAIQEASNKGLPPELVKYFIGNDENSTKAGLSEYEQTWKNTIKKEIEKVFKQYGRVPDKSQETNEGLFSPEDVKKMSQSEVIVNLEKIRKSQARW
jgi:hypothetical protein